MRILALLLLAPLLFVPAFAQTNSQVLPTTQGTLNVDVSTDPDPINPGDTARVAIDFLNPSTDRIQEHIDYRMTVVRDGDSVFGPIPLTHTSTGSVKIPVEFAAEGVYMALIEVEGILFQPIPLETVSFNIAVGEGQMESPSSGSGEDVMGDGGGCLIATAAYGSELAPQVQQLREIRDNTVMGTESGRAFMGAFNQMYYAFSPVIADMERESPVFREAVRVALTPMLATLSVLDHIEIDSEVDMLAYGIGIISLNLLIYGGIPALAVMSLRRYVG
ncbi:conserved hypothetical protein [Cenarchaeum symbiosum A]|uniref:Copper-binding protein n=1 Tax=Cenarchaeum symbiosum (strain A) TaxID=414004 RepID=A0RYI6_CENSY|nr:conserved hypothetical protein [Cenarchaeum symbiosum A]